MFEYQLCVLQPGTNLEFSTAIPMLILGVWLRRVRPFSALCIRRYFFIIFSIFIIWALFIIREICQEDMNWLSSIIISVKISAVSLIVPLVHYYKEFK